MTRVCLKLSDLKKGQVQIAEPDDQEAVEQLRLPKNGIEQFIDHEAGKYGRPGTSDGDLPLRLAGAGKNIGQ